MNWARINAVRLKAGRDGNVCKSTGQGVAVVKRASDFKLKMP
jgi:hypothetical protein